MSRLNGIAFRQPLWKLMALKNQTSRELMANADALLKQAQVMLSKERPAALAAVRNSVAVYGFTAVELGLSGAVSVSKKKQKMAKGVEMVTKKQVKKKGSGVIRFADGTGNSWTGFGPRPAWFKAAVSSGMSEDSLRV